MGDGHRQELPGRPLDNTGIVGQKLKVKSVAGPAQGKTDPESCCNLCVGRWGHLSLSVKAQFPGIGELPV